jgi:hypothetical protein
MLSARNPQLRATGTKAISRAPGIARVTQRAMAQLTVYVKGDPAANKLLDCEFGESCEQKFVPCPNCNVIP